MNKSEIQALYPEIEAAERNSHRSFDDYCDFFGFQPEDLHGKRILDVGAGKSHFSVPAQDFGAQVVELDPRPEKKKGIDQVQYVAQHLPFRDNSFDRVITSYGIFWIKKGLADAISEMIRTAREKAIIHPISLKNRSQELELPPGAEFVRDAQNPSIVLSLSITKDPTLHDTELKRKDYVNELLSQHVWVNSHRHMVGSMLANELRSSVGFRASGRPGF